MTDLSPSLLVRLNEVRKQVLYVQKDAQIQNYRAVTHDMVTAVIRPALVEQEIFFFPSVQTETVRETGTTKSGSTMYRYEAVFRITICAPGAQPETGIQLDIPSHGQDMGDKAPGKALSMAVKYCQLKALNLETGENEEGRIGDPGKKIIDHLKEELTEYLESGDSLAVFLLGQSVGEDLWSDIFNSAPAGKKVAYKKQISESEQQGFEVLKAIKQAILKDDDLQAKENLADLTPGGKRLLASHIGHADSAALGKLVK